MVVYKITNKINKKIYIGKSKLSVDKRWKRHIQNALYYKRKGYFYTAIRKYGQDNFNLEILEEIIIESELNNREKYWIKYYQSNNKNIGYNMTEGGDGGCHGEEHKAKLRLYRLGTKLTDEHKRKISEANKGKEVTKETRDKLSKALTGKEVSKETRKKLSAFHKNKPGFFKGRYHSEETKLKLSVVRQGKTYEELFGVKKAKEMKEVQKLKIGVLNSTYKEIDREVLKDLIKKGLLLTEIADRLTTSKYVIRTRIKDFWGCKDLRLVRKLL